ncbi:inter-alpha-trypsin inhibitor heavy chain H3-like [Myxocyprinus asiaticus]|uniref:inter-alpha-trypsin inhibitor heavy chain H3-like n=1 Tax=Myxocyprinus asiaticus TaxID=70543 RepID=UPI002221A118|nr:inter-alpha-trypsin inhibitor heavy chain H3-like [Myxocyprinus asiaticus]
MVGMVMEDALLANGDRLVSELSRAKGANSKFLCKQQTSRCQPYTTKDLNAASVSHEVFFDVDIPKTAFITNFSIEIEEAIYFSELLFVVQFWYLLLSEMGIAFSTCPLFLGPRSLPEILESIHNTIAEKNITLLSLAFGANADYVFLDTLSKQNNGMARRIYEDSDAPLQLQGFYEEVASPLLSEVNFHYPDNTVNSLTRSHFKQLFNGSEIMVTVSAQGENAHKWDTILPDEEYIFGDFTERLWAYLTIQELLDKKEKGSPDEKGNATAEALNFSLKYNFVTPLTSMVITKPESNDSLIADKLTEGHVPIPSSNAYRASVAAPTYFVDGDPHFIIELPDQNDALCFNIDDKPGTIFNLVRDPLTGIVVNGQTIGDKKVILGKKVNTYFGRFGIVHEMFGIRLTVSTKEVSVSEAGKQAKFFWTDTATIKGPNMDLKVIKDRSLTVTLKNSVRFLIILHKVWKKHPYHQDYLGFYTLDSHLLSHNVHGLLGQFCYGVEFKVSDLFPGEDPDKPDAIMFVKGHELVVTRGWQRDFRQDVKNGENVPCWFIHNNGTGLLDGVHTDYIVSGLFKTI